MEAADESKYKENEFESISASPDFAQIYVFIQNFGRLLKLPFVTLTDLEQFFIDGYQCEENQVAYIQHRLLSTSHRSSRREWQKAANKFARVHGLCDKETRYDELPVSVRVKLLRLSCEDQFDYNVNFKNELKREGIMEIGIGQPLLGVDSKGQRHWLLKDAVHNIRLYGDSNYDEESPDKAEWVELVKSLDELADYIAIVESSRGKGEIINDVVDQSSSLIKKETVPSLSSNSPGSVADAKMYPDSNTLSMPSSTVPLSSITGVNETTSHASVTNTSSPYLSSQSQTMVDSDPVGRMAERKMKSRNKRKNQSASKKAKSSQIKKPHPVWDGDLSIKGCIKCRKDVDYQQMLLCDECDRECHTYCQYPKLWVVPKGKWICPICKEGHLIDELRRIYFEISAARTNYERSLERKQRSIARLQRSGLLLQNIIMEEGEEEDIGRRPRRSRKEINYAELNDVHLPRLGPDDFIQSGNGESSSSLSVSKRKSTRQMDQYIQKDYLAPRFRTSTRRLRGNHDFVDVEKTSPNSNSSDVLNQEDALGSPPDDVLLPPPNDVSLPIGLMSDHRKYSRDGSESSYETDSSSFETELTVTIDRDAPNPCLIRTNFDSISCKGGPDGSMLPVRSDPRSIQTKIVDNKIFHSGQTDVDEDENVHATNNLETGGLSATAAAYIDSESENQHTGLGSQCSGYDSSEMEI